MKNDYLNFSVVERRNMVAAFISEQLFLVGGVGKYRRKLKTVEKYDINAGENLSLCKFKSKLFYIINKHRFVLLIYV